MGEKLGAPQSPSSCPFYDLGRAVFSEPVSSSGNKGKFYSFPLRDILKSSRRPFSKYQVSDVQKEHWRSRKIYNSSFQIHYSFLPGAFS